MSLSTILAAKDLSQSYQPLLLCEITFADGTILRLSTHDLRTSTTGIQYGGHDWLPQILNQDVAAKQALSSDGIDSVPTVTLQLADADKFLFINHEQVRGFKGASCVLRFVFYDIAAGTFSSDSLVVFRGICDPPNVDESTLSIRAVSKLNMTRANLPTTRIQVRDPHPFPNTYEDRVAALNDPSSPFYPCGYSADVPGGFGNLDEHGEAYTADDYDGSFQSYLKVLGSGSGVAATGTVTLGTGLATGQVSSIAVTDGGSGYTHAPTVIITGDGTGATATAHITGDAVTSVTINNVGNSYTHATVTFTGGTSADLLHDYDRRYTGTFGGVRWTPPNTFNGRQYTTGKIVTGNNAVNQNLYQDFVPMVYGTGMLNPVVVSILGEPNSTRGEAIVNLGYASIENEVLVVNNVNVTRNSKDSLMNWNWVNQGLRNGSVNTIPIFDGNGDCYGSMSTAWWTVYQQVASASSVPDIRCVVKGGQVRVYSDTSTFTTEYSDNPIWVLMDLLVKSGAWVYSDFDIQTFINAAGICARSVSYTSADGSTKSHPLFQTSLVIRQRQSAADYIKGLRTSCRATLVPNSSNNGLLQVFIDGTLADQQGSAVTGSNYNTAISSINHAGTATNGYVAYDFSDTNGTILRVNGKSTLRITQSSITSTPNALSFSFQDQENHYQTDSITIVDSLDVSRAAQEVNTSFAVNGISSYDHAQRIGAWWLAKTLRGNPRGDTGGTLHFAWTTNFKALYLQVGQIVRLSSTHDDLSNVLVRITSVKPSANFETVDLEGDWHEDTWYQDQFGQSGFNTISNPNRGRQNRPPYPWLPNTLAPVNTGDPLYSQSTFTFDVAQQFTNDASGNPIANLLVKGKVPVNQFSTAQAPLVRSAYSTSSTGGSLPGDNTYSLCVCGMDSDGLYTTPSAVVNVPVAAGTNTNTVSLTDLTWTDGTVGYALFAGTNPNRMCFQSSNTGTPSSITLSTLQDQTWGCPDTEFSKLRVQAKKIKHSGVHGLEVTGVTSSTITKALATWTTNQLAGRVVTIIANPETVGFELPVLNYHIVSNTADTLTVTGNPSADGVSTGDVMVVRTLATTHTDTTIGDSSFENFQYPTGMDADAEIGNIVRIIAGTGAGQTATVVSNTSTVLTVNTPWSVVPDGTSVFIVEEPTFLEDFTVTPLANPDPDTDTVIPIKVDNFLTTTLFVQVSTLDAQGVPSLERNSVWREVYLFGAPGEGVTTITPLGWQSALNALPQDSL